MKKIIAALLALITLFTVIGCSSSTDVVALSLEQKIDSPFGPKIDAEYDESSDEFLKLYENSEPQSQIQITFEGKTYTGTYNDSYSDLTFNSMADEYLTEDEDVSFSVRRDNGDLMEVKFYNPDRGEGDKTFEECEKIAENIAKKYIDVSEYELTADDDADLGDDEGVKYKIYNYCYTRMIDGEETSDLLNIVIGGSGEILLFENYTWNKEELNKCDSASSLNKIKKYCSEEAVKKIEEKLEIMYPGYASYEIVRKVIVYMKTGNPGVAYNVDVRLKAEKTGEDEYASGGANVRILVTDSNDVIM